MSLSLAIKKRYPGFALDIALEAGDERVALLGASGCGKSCTLRCIAGVETPDEGRIVVNGVTFFDSAARVNLSPQERKCALLFQNYQLFPHLTVGQNVEAGMDRALSAARRADLAPALPLAFRHGGLCRPLPRAALGRPAAARCPRPHDRGAPGHLHVRRAHERARRLPQERPRAEPARPLRRARRHGSLREPRYRRGLPAVRPHRRHARGPRGGGGDACRPHAPPADARRAAAHRLQEHEPRPQGGRHRGRGARLGHDVRRRRAGAGRCGLRGRARILFPSGQPRRAGGATATTSPSRA